MTTPVEAKNIALFIDGTWNSVKAEFQTNVRKMFNATIYNENPSNPQVAYYLPGVGSDIKGSARSGPAGHYKTDETIQRFSGNQAHAFTKKYLGGIFGEGTAARIKEAYAFLCTEYDQSRGDRVYIFGFSRGAFAARSLAGFIGEIGILLKNNLDSLEHAFNLYESPDPERRAKLQPFLKKLTDQTIKYPGDDRNSIKVHLLGAWDTVAALGLPGRLKRFSAPRTEYHQFDTPPNIMRVRHAIAMHEQRKSFEVLPFSYSRSHPDVIQAWFTGAHADVGGGYPDDESGLSLNALSWMMAEAASAGLYIDSATVDCHVGKKIIHSELKGVFRYSHPQPRRFFIELYEQCISKNDNVASLLHFPAGCEILKYNDNSYRQNIIEAFKQIDQLHIKLYILSELCSYNQDKPLMITSLSKDSNELWQSIKPSDLQKYRALLDSYFEFTALPKPTENNRNLLMALTIFTFFPWNGYTTWGYLSHYSRYVQKLVSSKKMKRSEAIDLGREIIILFENLTKHFKHFNFSDNTFESIDGFLDDHRAALAEL
ncbi:DUF2235 domain-containing protein [Pseudomonas putida]